MTERRELNATEIRDLLDDIGRRLASRGLEVTALVVGGAAIALTIGTRDATTDVDAVARQAPEVYAIADEIAAEHGLLEGWFNPAAAPWVPPVAYEWSTVQIVTGGLTAHLADPRTLLAMKMLANRARDFDDLIDLARELGLKEPAELLQIVHAAYPDGVGSKMPTDEDILIDAAEIIRFAQDA
ncbi:DUF6036 domain-containing protein [Occultella aeris]|uniref:DUF6036 domain-containing protein n=1 Tax=Occultella aeris TaxID=2761496 RepID=A0A7M4DRE9_9MICO|nr:DUF6036 family nucleotidyltransferase [Occultella aeris]VZO40043.1 hypothetical protein HALOF300_04744 [Occultella aeris]